MSAAVGIGARASATPEVVARLVGEALARAGLRAAPLWAPDFLARSALAEAAARLGLDLRFCDAEALRAAGRRVVSHSPRVAALHGVGSVAEAAALVGAGEAARVLVPKFSAEGVSVAVAGEGP